jgi:plastocyanin
MRGFGIARFPGFWARFVALSICLTPIAAESQERAERVVTMQVAEAKEGASSASEASNVVVWLSPLDHSAQNSAEEPAVAQSPQLVQRNKSFEPHVLVVRVGTVVQFPNKDPFFHNIFSLYDGKRFDLGLYEAGTTRSVRFDRPGVSFLFCNIHAEMSAVVIAVDTPYFAISDRAGRVSIPNVPDGRYIMHVWYERGTPESLKTLTHLVSVSESTHSLPAIRFIDNPDFTPAHKNKYGQDYVPPPTPGYLQP